MSDDLGPPASVELTDLEVAQRFLYFIGLMDRIARDDFPKTEAGAQEREAVLVRLAPQERDLHDRHQRLSERQKEHHTMTTAAPNTQPTAAEVLIKRLRIDPAKCLLQAAGLAWREFQVRLPEGAELDWSRVKANQTLSVMKADRVRLIAHDESWLAEAIVAGPSLTGVRNN